MKQQTNNNNNNLVSRLISSETLRYS